MSGSTRVIATLELVNPWAASEDIDDTSTDLSTFRSQVSGAAEKLSDQDHVEILYDRVLAEAGSASTMLQFISLLRLLLLSRGLLVRGSITTGTLRVRDGKYTLQTGALVTWHAFGTDVSRAYTLQQYLAGIGVFVPVTFVRAVKNEITGLLVESEFVAGAPRAFPRRYWDVPLPSPNTNGDDYTVSLTYLTRILRYSRTFGRQLIPLLITCVRSGWAEPAGPNKPNPASTDPSTFGEWLLSREITSRLKTVPGGTFPYLALLDWLLDTHREVDRAGKPRIPISRVHEAIERLAGHAFFKEALYDAPETLLAPENRLYVERILRELPPTRARH